MMKLYTKYRNSAGQRVRIALNIKGVQYEYVAIEDMRTEAYRRINPQGLLPALEVDGNIFGQSTAIIEWLDETNPTPSLFPTDPLARMSARSFSQHIACEIHPIHNHRVRDYLTDKEGWSDEKSMRWYEHWILEGLGTLEDMLEARSLKTKFCFSDEPSIADIYLVPVVTNARWFGFDVSPFNNILQIVETCERLEAFQTAAPDQQPDFPKP